jgi:hypothetical protein
MKEGDKNFLPTLYPMYEEFMYQLSNCGFFACVNAESIPHEKIDRPYWGVADANGNGAANFWNDKIDAIQIRKMQLFVNPQ